MTDTVRTVAEIDWTLSVTFGGVLVAASAFIFNQVHAVCARRRDFLIALLEAVNLSFSRALGDVEHSEQNKALARAAAMAELGLNGKARQTALDFIHRLGPNNAPVEGESRRVKKEEHLNELRDALNEFTPALWKHAHPFRRWVGRRPPNPAPDEVFFSTGRRR